METVTTASSTDRWAEVAVMSAMSRDGAGLVCKTRGSSRGARERSHRQAAACSEHLRPDSEDYAAFEASDDVGDDDLAWQAPAAPVLASGEDQRPTRVLDPLGVEVTRDDTFALAAPDEVDHGLVAGVASLGVVLVFIGGVAVEQEDDVIAGFDQAGDKAA